jgi:hypothetical protein
MIRIRNLDAISDQNECRWRQNAIGIAELVFCSLISKTAYESGAENLLDKPSDRVKFERRTRGAGAP